MQIDTSRINTVFTVLANLRGQKSTEKGAKMHWTEASRPQVQPLRWYCSGPAPLVAGPAAAEPPQRPPPGDPRGAPSRQRLLEAHGLAVVKQIGKVCRGGLGRFGLTVSRTRVGGVCGQKKDVFPPPGGLRHMPHTYASAYHTRFLELFCCAAGSFRPCHPGGWGGVQAAACGGPISVGESPQ